MKRTVYEEWVKSYSAHINEPIMVMAGKFYRKWAAEMFETAFEEEFGFKPVIFVTEEDKTVETL
nr:hypothetical protein YSBCXYJI_YSBCXYJI_CDS_0069 [Caudoviricetes sp.]